MLREQYSTSEIAQGLGVTERWVQIKAAEEKWASIPRPGRGGGNLYPYLTLPPRVKLAILQHHFSTTPEMINNPERDMEEIAEGLRVYSRAPLKNREEAEARMAMILAFHEFLRERGAKSIASHSALYVEQYRRRAVPGLDSKVYERVGELTARSLKTWERDFRQGGLPALIAKTWERGGKGRRKLPVDIQMVFVAKMGKDPHIKTAELVRTMRDDFSADMQVDRATVYRWHAEWKRDHKELYTLMVNPSDWKNKYQPAFGTLATAPYAGHTWQMDSTPADVRTADGKRCAIVAAIDVYSRRVVCVVSPTSKSDAVAACIRKGILAWGVPKKILKDNGADYSSRRITAVATALDIETPKLPPYSPEHKGNIERFFGTLTRGLEELLPQFLGHSVAEQAAIRARGTWAKRVMSRAADNEAVETPLTMGELAEAIDAWIDARYENRAHGGFATDFGRKLKGKTPLEAFNESSVKPAVINNPRVLDILLAQVSARPVKISKRGIRYNNGRYVHPDLVGYVGRDAVLRLCPEDAGAVNVYVDDKYVCTARDEAMGGETLSEYLEKKARHKKKMNEVQRAQAVLSKHLAGSYTQDLLTGKLTSAAPAAADKGVVEFRPEFNGGLIGEAKENLAALDAAPAPAPRDPHADLEGYVPGEFIMPRVIEFDKWAKMPFSAMGSEYDAFEWYQDKTADGRALSDAEIVHAQELWDASITVRGKWPRPKTSFEIQQEAQGEEDARKRRVAAAGISAGQEGHHHLSRPEVVQL